MKEHDKEAARVIEAWANVNRDIVKQHLATVLIDWCKGSQIELTNELKDLVQAFFEREGANNVRTKEDKQDRQMIVARGIIIECLHSLSKEQVKKLEKALVLLVEKHI